MKVVFLQDVPNVARAGEVKEVAAGYGRNFLIPKKLAALADAQAISQVKTRDETEVQVDTELAELARALEGKEVNLKARAGAKERIYGSVTSADIAAELENVTGLVIDKRKIELDEPIRQLGSYQVSIKLAKDIVPKVMVTVTEEEAVKEEKPPKKEKRKAEKPAETEKKPAKKAVKKTTRKAEKAPAKKKTVKKPAKAEKKTAKKAEKAPAKAEKKTAKKTTKKTATKKTTKKEEKA
ncbi:MAG TPA: 50S ribosomal protein L9 [Dehalococcoidia bacterium]|nr:50S ribosomal protein L9 [Dehalococcoidia bacterium]